jgi:non-heme chloroperoxidase
MSDAWFFRVVKKVVLFLLINSLLYVAACIILVNWPIPSKQKVKNYDYSSIKKKTPHVSSEQKSWIKMRDGYTVFSRIYPSESKDVLVLLHGSGTESRYLRGLAQSLADAKVATILTPDLRGHGASPGKKGDLAYMGQLEADVEDLIAYSKKNLGAKKITLAGHSSGGGFVLRFIGNAQNIKVDKAILLAPYLGHDAPTVKPNSGNWVTVAIKRWVGLSMLNRIGITRFDGLPVLFFNRPTAYTDSLQAPSYSYRMAVNFAPKDYADDIAAINTPCLVLVGGKDESFYPEKFPTVFEPAQRWAQTAILADANHLNIVSRKETADRIIEWMGDAKK